MDIKPCNILIIQKVNDYSLETDNIIKLSDFGTCKLNKNSLAKTSV